MRDRSNAWYRQGIESISEKGEKLGKVWKDTDQG